jgi:cell division protein ZapA
MQESEELIAATLLIGDRSYRIKVSPKDEEAVRKTVKTINDKVIEFKTNFAGKDMQDYVAMVLLWYATEQSNNTSREIDQEGITGQLGSIEQLLDRQLAK